MGDVSLAPSQESPRLIWDCGTAYDLFVSLWVLHEPSKYDLRGAWARGVRARLAPTEREILEQAATFFGGMGWVHTLSEPKDGATALQALEQISAGERLRVLMFDARVPAQVVQVLEAVARRGAWDENDRHMLAAAVKHKSGEFKGEVLSHVLEWWSRPDEFGERYLGALRAFYEAFFAEEEARIQPALRAALERAQALAERLELSALLEELSQGLRLAELPQVSELVLAPSFWSTPLLVFACVNQERDLILFGARPHDASLVPGEVVPDALMRALKALGDPTRLRILRYLTQQPLSPTQIARRLRLRAPTVMHHLDRLRMAGLVHLTLEAEGKRRYAARSEAVQAACAALAAFLFTGANTPPDC